MSSDIYVSFGADTAGLEASLASAKASVSALARELGTLAREQVKTGADAESALGQHMLAVARELDEAKRASSELKEKLGEGAEGGFLAGVKENLEGSLAPLSALKSNLGEIVELLAVAFAVEKIIDWVKETAELGEKLEHVSHELGVSAEEASRLQGMATLTGTPFETLVADMERLQLQLARTGESGGRAAAGLKALGINAQEFRALSIPQQIESLSTAFERFKDTQTKTAAAMALLGRSGGELITFLDKGNAGFEEMNETLARTGAVLSNEAVEGVARVAEQINELKLAWSGLSSAMFVEFKGAISGAIALITDLVESTRASIAEAGLLGDAFHAIGWAIQQTEQFIGETIWILKNLYVAGETATNILVAAFTGAGKVIADVFEAVGRGIASTFQGLITAAVTAVGFVEDVFSDLATSIAKAFGKIGEIAGQVFKYMVDSADAAFAFITAHLPDSAGEASGLLAKLAADAEAAGARIGAAFSKNFDFSAVGRDVKATSDEIAKIVDEGNKKIQANNKTAQGEYNKIWGIGGGPETGGEGAPKPQVPQMDLGGNAARAAKQALEAEISKLGELIDDYKELAKEKTKSLDDALAHQRISVQQWLSASEDALEDEKQDVEQTYLAEIAAAEKAGQKTSEIHRKMEKELAAINQQITDDVQKAADKTTQEWQNALNPVLSAWNSQLRGLLAGTESFRTAMKKIAADLVLDLIEQFEKLAVEKAALGLGNLFGQGPTGLLSGIGSALTGGAGATAQVTATAANTTALAALTTAITGQTAATVANTAADSGAAASGAGGLFGGLSSLVHLFGFAEGTDRILQGGLAVVHSGETIVPARGSGPYTGGGGGDTHVHLHMPSAIDSGSVRDWFHDNAAHVASALSKAVRNGDHLGLQGLGAR